MRVALVLLAIVLAFFAPLLTLSENDVRLGFDAPLFYWPIRQFAHDTLRSGVLPLWKPHSFCGQPFLASPETALYYPGFWLTLPLSVGVGMVWDIVAHVYLAVLGMYFFVRALTNNTLSAIFAGLSFGLGSFFLARIGFGHLPVIESAAGGPWVLLCAERALTRPNKIRWAVVTGLVYGLNWLAGFPDFSLMIGLVVATRVLAAILDNRHETAKILRAVAVAVLVTGGLASAQYLPALPLIAHAHRAATDFTGWALDPRGLVTLVTPNLLGTAADQNALLQAGAVEASFYVGVLPLCFALGFALTDRTRLCRCLVGLTIVGFVLALAGSQPVYHAIPGLRLIARSSRWVYLPALCLPILGGLGLAHFLTTELKPRYGRRILGVLIGAAAVSLVGGLVLVVARQFVSTRAAAWIRATYPDDPERRLLKLDGLLTLQTMGLFVLAALLFLLALLVWIRLRFPTDSRIARWLGMASVVLCVADLAIANVRHVTMAPKVALPPATAFTVQNAARLQNTRVLPLASASAYPEGGAFTGVASVTGYDSLVGEDYFLFLSTALGAKPGEIDPLSPTIAADDWPKTRSPLLQRLSVSYVASAEPVAGLSPAATTDGVALYACSQGLPFVQVVHGAVETPALTTALGFLETLPLGSVTVDTMPSPMPKPPLDTEPPAQVRRIDGNTLEVRCQLTSPGILVFRETWDAGWRAEVDNNTATLLKTDGIFLGVALPKGQHQVRFVYDPPLVKVGLAISLFTLFVSAYLLIFGGARSPAGKS